MTRPISLVAHISELNKQKQVLIEQVQAHNDSAVEAWRCSRHWQTAHDILLGFVQSKPELLKEWIEFKKNGSTNTTETMS